MYSMNNSFDIIVLSETWLSVDFNSMLYGYHNINSLGEANDDVTIFVENSF